MAEKVEVQPETLLNLDDLLQCPVCYEIPTGQIFQCNEGHHVCGRCKIRLDVCPVCRALFFGTRNYAMEELIANFRKLRTFKLGGKLTKGSSSTNSNAPAHDASSGENENDTGEDEEINPNIPNQLPLRAPPSCKGLFRCLCCKNGNAERLPSARLLNHLRYFHSPDLIEGQSDNGEYLQAWQFSTTPGRLVTAIRISDMGVFFLIIEISSDSLCAWLTMAASPWVAHEYCYTVTISGNDREAIFNDCVWSVRSCEGSLKKRGHCLVVNGLDATALIAPATISGKLSLRRMPSDQLAHQTQPRAVMRVANRGNNRENVFQELQVNVVRLTRAFATFEANSLARIEAELLTNRIRDHIELEEYNEVLESAVLELTSNGDTEELSVQPQPLASQPLASQPLASQPLASQPLASQPLASQPLASQPMTPQPLSRNARRRLRHRLRTAFDAPPVPPPHSYPQVPGFPMQNGHVANNVIQQEPVPTPQLAAQAQTNGPSTSTQTSQNGNQGRNNKKCRQRR